MGNYICTVCGFAELAEAPYRNGIPSYEICPCCGFEFGYDDQSRGQNEGQYRMKWLENGAPWFQENKKPLNWDVKRQLENIPNEIISNEDIPNQKTDHRVND